LASVGPALLLADPAQNLIFSAHAYWYSYAGNESSQMEAKINNAVLSNIAFVFGELAYLQDDASMCQYTLNYKALLRICKRRKPGWLAWSWDNDGCAARQVTSSGNFSGLSAYGQVIVNDLEFGLAKDSVPKSKFLKPGGCLISKRQREINSQKFHVFPNPCHGKIQMTSLRKVENIEVISILGETIQNLKNQDNRFENQEVTIGSKPGIYWLRVNQKYLYKIVNLGF
jgi:mannan endo-1,4-beta-mannosidase